MLMLSGGAVHDHAKWYIKQVIVPTACNRAAKKLRRASYRQNTRYRDSSKLKTKTKTKTKTQDWQEHLWSWLSAAVWGAIACAGLLLYRRYRRQARALLAAVLRPSELLTN